MSQALRSLLAGLIDYAGLFPPAKLNMQPAAEAFARARMGEHEWILGRFICPASRLREFSQAASVMMPGTHATSGYREYADIAEPWRLSVLCDGDLHADLETIAKFNAHHEGEDHGRAAIDAIELKVSHPDKIDGAIEMIPDELFPFFEFPADVVMNGDCRGFVAALAGHGAAAKIRTGGVTPDAFPSPRAVADFMFACRGAGVAFKATAGLHHPVRAEFPLTYEPGCPTGTMHGFLNVFVAAAMIHEGNADRARATAIIEDRRPESFHFTEEGVRWDGLFIESTQIAQARELFCLSYGSCSFDEPVADLAKLRML